MAQARDSWRLSPKTSILFRGKLDNVQSFHMKCLASSRLCHLSICMPFELKKLKCHTWLLIQDQSHNRAANHTNCSISYTTQTISQLDIIQRCKYANIIMIKCYIHLWNKAILTAYFTGVRYYALHTKMSTACLLNA